MNRAFIVHPKNIKYIDPITTQNTGNSLNGENVFNVNYIVKSNVGGQNVTYQEINCPLSNSIYISTFLCKFISTTNTPPANPATYYTAYSVNAVNVRPYVKLWLKENKIQSSYVLDFPVGYISVNTINTYTRYPLKYVLKLENIDSFDTFQIYIDYGVTSIPIDIIGNEDTGTSANSRNNISPLGPFCVNTYWKL